MKINRGTAFYIFLAVLLVWAGVRLFAPRIKDSSLLPVPSGSVLSSSSGTGVPSGVSPQETVPSSISLPAPAAVEGLLVDNFDRGRTSGIFTERLNSLGSYQGTWAKRPSYSVITKSFDHRRGDLGQGLTVEWKKDGGWCGWYTLLMDERYRGVDVSDYNALTFWVKGDRGGEVFDIGLADFKMQELEIDAVYAGSVKNFLPKGVTKEWQKVRVPISRVASDLDLSSMGSLVFWFRYGGSGKIHVEDIWFENDPEVLAQEEYNAPKAEPVQGMGRSLWVWKIDPIQSLKAREELFKMCERSHIDTIYQYFGDFHEEEDPEYAAALEEFLIQAHARGIYVEALTGNPVWALRYHHEACLTWIRGFLDFNSRRPPEARIDGVSLDVEPYLTAEWNTDRAMIKEAYLELLDKCRALVDSYGQDFKLGAAIPLLYQHQEASFERSVLEKLDYVALMSYYDTSKAIIEQSQYHIELAADVGRKVYLGVETQDLVRMNQGKRRNTYIEEGWEQMEKDLLDVHNEFQHSTGYGGVALHCFYAYKLLQRGRNVPKKDRPAADELYALHAKEKTQAITIDGDLSDWDLSMPFEVKKKDHVVFGAGAWRDPLDLSFIAYSQWDKDNLYIAFEMIDNKVMQEKTGGDMWEGDHMELWLDVQLEADYYEAVNSNDDLQLGLSPGNFTGVEPEVHIWVPDIGPGLLRDAQIASRKTERGYILETRLPARLLFSAIPQRVGVDPSEDGGAGLVGLKEAGWVAEFVRGMKIGIMMDASDTDDAMLPQKCLISSSTGRIWGDPTTFGVLSLE